MPLIAASLALLLLLGALLVALIVQPFALPISSTPPAVAPEDLHAHVRRLSVDLHPRGFGSVEQLDRVGAYIREQLAATGGKVFLQPVTVQGRAYSNVVARYGPDTGPVLVIGAHYDTHGSTPGADDNASGVAGLIELGRLLGRHPPPQPVELVAYTLEEMPYFSTEHMGSAWHAKALKDSGQEVRLMISLEMIGYFSDAPGSQAYPWTSMSLVYPPRGDFIAVVGRFGDFGTTRRAKAIMRGASTLPVHSINAPPNVPGIDLSDHLNYWRHGYPALMLTDTAFMRNPHYHQPTDTHDTLDYARMAEVVRGVYAVAQGF